MKHLPRVLMLLSSLLLIALFFFPIWEITLIAPQYPDGIKMYIYINKIGGESPGTLQNINILNHYIGMKKIVPDAIPELKIIPFIMMGMIGLGALAAIINKRQVFLWWGLLFVVLAVIGVYDFYLWEYDYGHTLDPNAPMKFPGASFQPPLFGSKDIINFTAKSYPHLGGYLAGLAMLLSFLAYWLKPKKNEQNNYNPTAPLAAHA